MERRVGILTLGQYLRTGGVPACPSPLSRWGLFLIFTGVIFLAPACRSFLSSGGV